MTGLNTLETYPIITGLLFQREAAFQSAMGPMLSQQKYPYGISLGKITNKPIHPFSGLLLVEDILLILAMPICSCL